MLHLVSDCSNEKIGIEVLEQVKEPLKHLINAEDIFGRTPLLYAIIRHKFVIAEKLRELGCMVG
jgi:hypothetical protein